MPDITRVIDVIQPEVFTPYTINRTMELSAPITSSIAENNKEFDELASGPNLTANMPFWNDLEGDLEIMDDKGESDCMSSSNYRRNKAYIEQYRKELKAMMDDIRDIDIKILNKAVNEGVKVAKGNTPVKGGIYT